THSLLREIADDFPDKSRAAAKLLFSDLDRAIRSILDEAELLVIREAAKIKDYSALKKVNPEIHDTIKTYFGEVRKSIDEY
ncbi:hypothetical protein NQ294_33700, partial [Escherichia coli]|nr:hypothetical protein [Escherichia coli]